ncbi:MAG: amidohydrolase, partial [Thiolinea sp.]
CAPEQPATNWVLGSGHSVFTLLEAERLPVEILDEAIPDRPALIMEETSHSVWVSSKALEVAGIDKNTPNPVGGVIVKDPDSGEPTGVLFDAAGDVLMSLAWLPTAEIKQLNYEGLLAALAEVNSYGITSIAEGRTYWKRDFQDAWLQAEREGTLTVRAMLNWWAYPAEDDAKQIARLRSLYRDQPDSLVRASQIKVYSDGILVNSTAAMLAPYLETLGEIPGDNGLNYFTEQRLTKYMRELSEFDFHIHVIGDRGVREGLNAIAAAGNDQARHRLTHLEVVDKRDYPRFKQLGVIADMQVAGSFTQPFNWSKNAFLIGKRTSPFVPLRDLYEAGAQVTLSSDWDVSTLNPFVGMQNAVTRKPQQLPNVAAAIKAYTLTPAYALRQEDITGSIEVGKQADLIVLDRNLLEIPLNEINKTTVLETYLAGERVYVVE